MDEPDERVQEHHHQHGARRAIHQRRVNRLDSDAKGRLADSLINAELVRTFTNEALEIKRFDGIMQDWGLAAYDNQWALFRLHVGQSLVIAFGVASVMLLAGADVLSRHLTVGDLVLINAFMLQICLPLNSLGFVYREARDALQLSRAGRASRTTADRGAMRRHRKSRVDRLGM